MCLHGLKFMKTQRTRHYRYVKIDGSPNNGILGPRARTHGFRCNSSGNRMLMPSTSHDSRVGGISTPVDVCREKVSCRTGRSVYRFINHLYSTSPVQNYLQLLLNLVTHKSRPLDLTQQQKCKKRGKNQFGLVIKTPG